MRKKEHPKKITDKKLKLKSKQNGTCVKRVKTKQCRVENIGDKNPTEKKNY